MRDITQQSVEILQDAARRLRKLTEQRAKTVTEISDADIILRLRGLIVVLEIFATETEKLQ